MEKKGTGWIPDYPDLNDYTLQSNAINNLANRIQSQGGTASIDNLAQKVYEALGILAEKPGNKNLKGIREELNKEILGGLSFVTAKFHNVFKEGMADSEVLLIKNYLNHIMQGSWMNKPELSSHQVYQSYDESLLSITDATFNSLTSQLVQDIQKAISTNSSQKQREADGCVDDYDLAILEVLADISSMSSTKILKNINETWKKNRKIPDEQINFAIYLQDIYDKLEYFHRTCQEYIGEEAEDKENHPLGKIKNIKKFPEKLVVFLDNLDSLKKAAENFYTKNASTVSKLRETIEEIRDYLETPWNKDRFASFHVQELEMVLENKDTLLNEFSLLKLTLEKFHCSKDTKHLEEACNQMLKVLLVCRRSMLQLYTIKIPKIPLEMFEKIEPPIALPIPINPVSQLVEEKLLNENLSESKYLQEELEVPLEQKLKSSLTEVIVQMLMPLGQHSNLSQGVDREIKKAQYLVDPEKDNQEESKKLIREIIEVYKVNSVINLDTRDYLDFKGLIFETIFEIIEKIENGLKINKLNGSERAAKLLEVLYKLEKKEIKSKSIDDDNLKIIKNFFGDERYDLESPGEEIEQLINTPLYFIFKRCLKRNSSEQNKKKRSVQAKKPIFEISKKELRRIKEDDSEDDLTSQEMRNRVIFPINYFLRNELVSTQNDETQEESENAEKKRLRKPKQDKEIFLSLPEFVDLTYWCSPVEDQGSLNSCTAHAGIALMEYFEKKSSGTYIDGSPRFLYKVTRNLIQREGDSGASVRDTMKAMVAFGVCPEQYWLYDEDKYDEEPTPFCYSFAENYKTLKYFRLDYASISRYTLLAQVKVLLASEIPCIFGFTLYNSVYDEFNVQRGHIPLPDQCDTVIGGHTVVAVGYHDRKVIENADGERAEGALLIRNSWGTRWGQGGYGWLPYDYVIQGLTADWWSLIKTDWLATGRFGAGASAWNPDKGNGKGVRTGQRGSGGKPR